MANCRKRQIKRAYMSMCKCRLHRLGLWNLFKRLNKYPISPLKMGRMNGRCWGYNVQFFAIDEIHSYGQEG